MENSDLNLLTDEILVRMAQEGSSTAEEYLINKYKGLAKSKAKTYFIVGGDNDDVIQEGMIGIFKAIRDFDEEKRTSFLTFAELCVTRQILSAINGANRQKNQILNESISLSDSDESGNKTGNLFERLPSGEDTNPEALTLMREVVTYLKNSGEEIFSSFEKKVWEEMLRGKNYKEIATQLHRPSKTIDNAIQRIKKKISTHLE